MLLGDQPISDSSQDQLDRADFCRYLSRAIMDYNTSDCIVLGLMGSWGSGKSSMLNMITEFLNKSSRSLPNTSRPILVRFNPWNYPEQDKVLMQFFYNLSSRLQAKRIKSIKLLGEKVLKYADSFIPFNIMVDSFKKSVSLRLRTSEKKSIDYKKEKLVKEFRKLKSRIIVMIDDVDRLEKNDIKKLFQLTKSFGNFPNVIYMIAFDRKIVARALADDNIKDGEEYLEKIIQVPFEIPSIPRDKVLSILDFQVRQIFKEIPDDSFDEEYWNSIYYSSIQYFFRTIRDINRYINSLKIGLPFIIKEVNPIDFIAITCIQVFFSKIYLIIKDNKGLLTSDSEENSTSANNGLGEVAKNILTDIPKKDQERIKSLLCYLFPMLRDHYNIQPMGTSSSPKKDIAEKRIYISRFFNTYFRLSVPEHEVNQDEMERLIESTSSEKDMESMLLLLSGKEKIPVAIDSLRYRIKDIPVKNRETAIRSLLDVSDMLKIDDMQASKYNDLVYLLLDLLFRIDSEDERFRILESAIRDSRSLYVSSLLVLKLRKESKKKQFLIDGFKVLILEDMLAGKIRQWTQKNNAADNRNFHHIIYNWAELDSKIQVKRYINKYISDDENLISFISSNLEKKYSVKDNGHIPVLEYDLKHKKILEFIDIPADELAIRIRNILNSGNNRKLESLEKTALELFTKKIQ